MCGIVGQINLVDSPILAELEAACQALKHRGPDGHGVESITEHLAFGHTRLAFLDLGQQGGQPMFSADKKVCISFNGEIYNYLELKEELSADYQFSTTSDTEVILAAYQKWGLKMLDRFEGMFAFGLYDSDTEKLYLVRDLFGIKPLYYYSVNDQLIFGSELKALQAFKGFQAEIDWTSFCDYFVYRYVPSPKTIWQNTYKVPPASYLEVDTQTLSTRLITYWTPEFSAKRSKKNELIAFVGKNMQSSVSKHARADVPIGSFLSGGYDSSAIVSYLTKANYSPLTFSIGFSNWEKSEDYYAKQVADHLQLSNEAVIADQSSLDKIDLMPQVFDEPIADISIIPTYLVSQLASKELKAVMSGEGADELFGGYHWQKEFYTLSHPSKIVDKLKRVFLKKDTIAFYANAMSMGTFDGSELKKMLHPRLHSFIPTDVHWFYRKHYKHQLSPLKSIQYLDMKCFMGELVLTKVDRASMANSLEVRVPFLNRALFEKIYTSAEKDYYKADETKHLLYQNLKDELPPSILNRDKQGFVGPDSYYMDKVWYRKELKNSRLVTDKIIKQSYIDQLLSKDYDWRIWKILVMEKWYAHWINEIQDV